MRCALCAVCCVLCAAVHASPVSLSPLPHSFSSPPPHTHTTPPPPQEGLAALRALRRLQSLRLALHGRLDVSGAGQLAAALASLPLLQELRLHYSGGGAAGGLGLGCFAGLQGLRVLQLTGDFGVAEAGGAGGGGEVAEMVAQQPYRRLRVEVSG